MATRKLSANVDEELYQLVMNNVEAEHISVSQYITKLLKSNIYSSTTSSVNNINSKGNVEVKERRIRLDEDTYNSLHEKATKIGLTDIAYIRNLIHTTDFKVYKIQTDDIEDLIGEVHKAINAMHSTVSLIKKQGKGVVFEQDIRKIIKEADDIKKTLNSIVRNLYDTRRSVQEKLTRKLNKQK